MRALLFWLSAAVVLLCGLAVADRSVPDFWTAIDRIERRELSYRRSHRPRSSHHRKRDSHSHVGVNASDGRALMHRRSDDGIHEDQLVRRDTTGSPSSAKCNRPVGRVSWFSLSGSEKTSWMDHFNLLATTKGKSMFVEGGTFLDDLAIVHIGMQRELHYNACFLPCHAALLRAFYSMMRLLGYRGREAYWPLDQDAAAVGGIPASQLWNDFGGDDGQGGPIPSGRFKGLVCGVLPDLQQVGRSIYKPHYVTRYFNDNWHRQPLQKGDMYSSLLQSELFDNILSQTDYTVFRQRLERTVHAYVHQAMGGEMWLFSAVCEPTFWLLHAEIDRIWRTWQTKQNTWTAYNGHSRIVDDSGNYQVVTAALDNTIDFYHLFVPIKVQDVMWPRKGILCYRYDNLYGGLPDSS
ncbi:Di-copper centre-containing protein [Testicularia cyperi]|uniref:Di-copper centre-containing protein n=1 Tax=Testicularia cyperi TaxID=1882483 RepID=A0A317XYW1_9BASI|nr:Di-copper centre-containing protein [Testicularia cyperi]